jgi:hypothetical protein
VSRWQFVWSKLPGHFGKPGFGLKDTIILISKRNPGRNPMPRIVYIISSIKARELLIAALETL